jgi:antitoxin ParD1/3/4
MGKAQKVSIALTEELAETARAAVASGDFGSSSEVVRAALREWGSAASGRKRKSS